MRILFVTGHYAFLRNFESVIRQLAQQGHRIHLAAEREDEQKRPHLGGQKLVEILQQESSQISSGWTPERKHDPWYAFGSSVRTSLDYLRFIRPEYQNSSALIRRAKDRTPGLIVWLADRRWIRERLPTLEKVLRLVERAIPSSPLIERFLLDQNPDVMLITPLLGLGSPQYDYLKSARAMGIRTVLCVTSWDHLSSKALIRELPDRIIVWNELQKAEAVKLHGVPPDRVVVTGAQCYDHWFEWQARTTREEFCRRVGLDSRLPYVLYVCSAFFRWAGDEPSFVLKWLQALRGHSDPRVRELAVLIRPHPARVAEWSRVDLSTWGNVALWPRAGGNPIDVGAKSDYYDSIYRSAAIVGINTSALIEAGIIGRPVHTILAREVAASQVETMHFHYLLKAGGGLLRAAGDFDEHFAQLAHSLDGTSDQAGQNRRFVETFVRPFGLDVPAGPRFVEAIEREVTFPQPTIVPQPVAYRLLQPLLFALALLIYETEILNRNLTRNKRLRGLLPARLMARIVRVLLRSLRVQAWTRTHLVPLMKGKLPSHYSQRGLGQKMLRRVMRRESVRSFMKKHVLPNLDPLAVPPVNRVERMKVLFVMAYPGYLRYFGSTVKLLAERGHEVTLAFDTLRKQPEGLAALEGVDERITVKGKWPVQDKWPVVDDLWNLVAGRLRGLMDYLRYLDSRFEGAGYLRSRMAKVLPPTFRFLVRVRRLPSRLVRLLLRGLSICEAAIPSNRTVEAFIESERPDVLLVTPLVNPASLQTELVKAAQTLGVRTCVCIASWDHLTTKGLIRVAPDRVIVWNAIQRREAMRFHSIPKSRIVVTGAQPFDDWFGSVVSVAYPKFCKLVGLDPSHPFVLFVGSTASISAPDTEIKFVRRWVTALRASGHPVLRDIGILIRPHPYNSEHWQHTDLSDFTNVTIWPRHGANPAAAADRVDYFASLYHSAAVVGINTSAMIEAAVVGRPVHTILMPEFQDTQAGTLHFHHLLPEHGGCTRVARSLEEHVEQLAQAVTNGDGGTQAAAQFIASFVRPRGVDKPCTRILVNEIEDLWASPSPHPRRPSVILRPVTRVLWRLAKKIRARADRDDLPVELRHPIERDVLEPAGRE